MALTTDDLISGVRRLAFLPDASDLTAADILAMADDEMTSLVGQLVKNARAEYWVVTEDIPLTSSLTYRIPRRAMDRTVRSVSMLDASGCEWPLSEESISESYGVVPDGWTRSYYFEADYIGFRIAPPTDGRSLRVRYLRRPSTFVPVASCAPIMSVTAPNLVTIGNDGLLPDTIAGTKFLVDIVRGDAPHDLMYVDQRMGGLSSGVVTLADASLDASLFVDLTTTTNARRDYLCPRDQTCYPPLSASEFPVLVAATARRLLEELGDRAGAQVAESTMQQRLASSASIIQPRNEQGSRAIINRGSTLRGGGFGGRRWR